MTPSLNILFVEDDTAVREAVARMLTDSGFRVLAATDGYDAVRLLTENHVDLLITDIVMPDLDGVELAKQAKGMRPNIKVLFATGYGEKAVAERDAMQHGRVVLKPLRQAELMREVEATLAV